VPRKDVDIGVACLVGNDLYTVEHLTEPGLGDFTLLIEKVALGDQDQPVFRVQPR